MTSLKPIHLFSHSTGPNPWKVQMILEELGLPFEADLQDMSLLHTPAYEKYNPNGRVPTIIDPNNNNLVLWESGAIIEYLIETYDKEHKISFASGPDKWYAKQFLFFQASGQGPYFGQAAWFIRFHHEKLPSAQERYIKEIKRVTKVLDGVLTKNGTGWLVGGKCSFADLSFVTWFKFGLMLAEGLKEENPAFSKWYVSMLERPAVKKTIDAQTKAMAADH